MPETPDATGTARHRTGGGRAASASATSAPATSAPAATEPAPGAPEALVTAVLVVHDGMAWLPECLDALAAQTVRPQRVVAVDTGSTDGSADLLLDRLGAPAVIHPPRDTPLGHAIAAGLAAFTGAPAPPGGSTAPTEWIWILHDDCAPDPGTLEALLSKAEGAPSIWAVAPKTRDWSGERLAEFGATIDRAGHRETWAEGHDLDQGQADARGEALAASTAGMLVRRSAWDLLDGMDDLGWPLADDLDLGWRITAAGGRVALAATAVVRHVGAMNLGARRPDLVTNLQAARRRSGMSVVLANSPALLAPVLWFRLVVGALWRALGLLVVLRRPSQARDELMAAVGVVRSAGRIGRSRRARRAGRVVPHRELRRSLAGVGDRTRHLIDSVRAAVPGRSAVLRAQTETGPVDETAESLDTDDGAALRRVVSRPSIVLTLIAVALSLVADRQLFGGGLAGGRLLPAPSGAHTLWAAYFAGFHPTGIGTSWLAPPALAVLALVASVLLGHAALAVDLILLLTVALSALSAWHASAVISDSAPVRLWAAVAWATLPAVTGAIAEGRLDICVAAILLPLVARTVAGALAAVDRPARIRVGRLLGTGLLLAVLAAFAPLAWVLVGVAGLLAITVAGRRAAARARDLAVILAVALVACEPWSLSMIRHPAVAVNGFGLPDAARRGALDTSHLMLLHPDGPGTGSLWVGAVLLLVALAALARRSRVTSVSWAVLVTGLGAALVVSRLHGVVPGEPASRASAGLPLLFAGLGAVAAAVGGVDGIRERLRRRHFGVAQPIVALLAVLAVAAVGWSSIVWIVRGAGGPLRAGATAVAPVYVGDVLATPTSPRALVIGGRRPLDLTLVRRSSGGDLTDSVFASAGTSVAQRRGNAALLRAVADLIAGRQQAVAELSALDVYYVVVADGSVGAVSQGADAIGATLTPATGVVVYRVPGTAGELTLDPTPTATATIALRAAPDGRADDELAASVAPRRLVLAEPASGHWQATLGGHALRAATVSGWEQGWAVPAGTSGRLHVQWSDPARTAELILEAVLVAGIALLALPLWRLEDESPATRRREDHDAGE